MNAEHLCRDDGCPICSHEESNARAEQSGLVMYHLADESWWRNAFFEARNNHDPSVGINSPIAHASDTEIEAFAYLAAMEVEEALREGRRPPDKPVEDDGEEGGPGTERSRCKASGAPASDGVNAVSNGRKCPTCCNIVFYRDDHQDGCNREYEEPARPASDEHAKHAEESTKLGEQATRLDATDAEHADAGKRCAAGHSDEKGGQCILCECGDWVRPADWSEHVAPATKPDDVIEEAEAWLSAHGSADREEWEEWALSAKPVITRLLAALRAELADDRLCRGCAKKVAEVEGERDELVEALLEMPRTAFREAMGHEVGETAAKAIAHAVKSDARRALAGREEEE